MNNSQIADVFKQIADLLEIKGEKIYRVLAYRRGAEAIRNVGQDIGRDARAAGDRPDRARRTAG